MRSYISKFLLKIMEQTKKLSKISLRWTKAVRGVSLIPYRIVKKYQ
ncbi:hypothetical protein LX99_01286 [Mucilaginibacter oryzae]|uniref:Uncharacterized protein n=1 Tax=Mucilaginibacter oryzae TaxID=468058 RepID=A0A316HF87_9SPHI|nr:hypothetical protein LX99_01286 [Mucilaginibacter oryzae]